VGTERAALPATRCAANELYRSTSRWSISHELLDLSVAEGAWASPRCSYASSHASYSLHTLTTLASRGPHTQQLDVEDERAQALALAVGDARGVEDGGVQALPVAELTRNRLLLAVLVPHAARNDHAQYLPHPHGLYGEVQPLDDVFVANGEPAGVVGISSLHINPISPGVS
jgi:hypothetical protein